MLNTRRRLVLALVASSIIVGLVRGRSDEAYALEPGDQVFAQKWRLVCSIPRSGNPQHVLGFDAGGSLIYNGSAYFGFGDTFVDNGDGVYGGGFEFRTGTIGKTTDLTAQDCIGGMTWTSTNGTNVVPAVPPNSSSGECLTWPGRPFVARNTIYFFYSVAQRTGAVCKDATNVYGTGLAKMTAPSAPDMGIQRVPGALHWAAGQTAYGQSPLKIGSYIYLFTASNGLRMARVRQASIENIGDYRYWTGSSWSKDPGAAVSLGNFNGSITFNAYLNRFLMLYACPGTLNFMCARTTQIAGQTEAALKSGWNEPTLFINCPVCGHPTAHTFTDPANPANLYVTTSTFGGRSYRLTLWEVELGTVPRPSGRLIDDSMHDWIHKPPPNPSNHWSYHAYPPTAPTALLALQPNPVNVFFGAHPPYTGPFSARVGNELVDGEPAPGVFADGMYPSANLGAARAWTAPANGTVEISGEAWLERTCGGGARAVVVWVYGSTPSQRTYLGSHLLYPQWDSSRENGRFYIKNVTVTAGSKIVLGIEPNLDPSCDLAFFPATIVFDPQ